MTFLTLAFKQTITYWAPSGIDVAGDLSFATPVTLTGRWEEKAKLLIGADGEEFTSNAIIYLPSDVVVEGYLFLGTSVASDPRDVTDAFKIKSFRKIPDITATNFERKAGI